MAHKLYNNRINKQKQILIIKINKAMKKIIFAVIGTVLVAGGIFYACQKEEKSGTTLVDTKMPEYKVMPRPDNPYDFIGKLHNEGLDYIAKTRNLKELNAKDINNAVNEFLVRRIPNYTEFSYEEMKQHLENTDIFAAQLYMEKIRMEEVLRGYHDAGRILDKLTYLFKNIYVHENWVSPEDFSHRIADMEAEVISWKKHNNPAETSTMNIYSVTLATLSVAKHSYEYWYNAEFNPNHPWYPEVKARSGNGDDKPGFFKRVWNAICDGAKAVGMALATPFVDTYGGIVNGIQRPTVPSGVIEINIINFCQGAISTSSSFWRNNW
jgi:hypothetical protein